MLPEIRAIQLLAHEWFSASPIRTHYGLGYVKVYSH